MILKNINNPLKTFPTILLSIVCLMCSACSHLMMSDKELASFQQECKQIQQDSCLHGDQKDRNAFYNKQEDFIREVERTNQRNQK